MKKENKEIILVGVFIILLIITFVVFITIINLSLDYLEYLSLKEDGYKVRYDINGYGCEIKMKQQDGRTKWMSCSLSKKYTIENFAIKENDNRKDKP